MTQPAFFLSVFSGMISKKEQFLQKDRLIKGITSDGFFKLSVVKTTEAVQLASQKHGLSPLAAVILGRALTGTILLAGELKGEERIRVDLQGNGPLEHVITEASLRLARRLTPTCGAMARLPLPPLSSRQASWA